MDATDADGYVVYYNAGPEHKKDVGNTFQSTLTILNGSSANITVHVRAYQDLLGPPSTGLSVETSEGEKLCCK